MTKSALSIFLNLQLRPDDLDWVDEERKRAAAAKARIEEPWEFTDATVLEATMELRAVPACIAVGIYYILLPNLIKFEIAHFC